jgi:hypothetical protein
VAVLVASGKEGVKHVLSDECAEDYTTAGEHDHGSLGEAFIKMSKQDCPPAGFMDVAFSASVSIGLSTGCRWRRSSPSTPTCASTRPA